MSPKRSRKRKTSRPLHPKNTPQQSARLESLPDRSYLLDRVRDRVTKMDTFSQMEFIKNPPGEEKMSDVLREFIEPHTPFARDMPSYERLVATAVVAWNAALMPLPDRARFLQKLGESFDPETREDFYTAVGELIKRKERHFAQYDRQIIDAQVTDLGDSYHLAVVSLLKPDTNNR